MGHLLKGWWKWTYPRAPALVHLVHTPDQLQHIFREELHNQQLRALEARCPLGTSSILMECVHVRVCGVGCLS